MNSLLGQFTLTGSVRDSLTNRPMVGVTIVLQDTRSGTNTDVDGNFQVTTNKPLPLILEVSHIGYATAEIKVDGADQVLDILMVRSISSFEQIVVSASRKREKETGVPSSVSIVEKDQLESEAVSHPIMSLRGLQGLSIQEQGIGTYQIGLRGRTSIVEGGETFVLVDYRQLNIPGLLFAPFASSAVDAIDLARVEVVRGPASALYGPGVDGGLIHFLSKDPFNYPGTTISISGGERSFFGTSVRHAGLLNKNIGYKILGFYRSAENWAFDAQNETDAGILNGFPKNIRSVLTRQDVDVDLDDTEVENMNFSATLQYQFNKETHLVATAGYGQQTGRKVTSIGYLKYLNLPNYFGQLRFHTNNLFAQVYFRNVSDHENSFAYYSGFTSYFSTDQLEAQIQYHVEPLFLHNLRATIGSDYRVTYVDSKRTLTGRNEDNDDYSIFGGYAQVEWTPLQPFRVIAAGRADHFSAVKQTTFSPRLGIVYQPRSTQAIRFTYNRAFGLYGAMENFFDFKAGATPFFDIRFWGSAMLLEYSPDPEMTSFYGPQYDGPPGMSHSLAYQLALDNLNGSNRLPQELINYLMSISPKIQGFSHGSFPQLFTRTEAAKTTRTEQFELGYKGILVEQLAIDVAVYHTRRKNFFSLQPANPFVTVPTLEDDLFETVFEAIDSDQLPLSYSPSEIAAVFSEQGKILGKEVGLIEPDLAKINGRPDRILTFLNFGKISYWGAEIALKYFVTNSLSAYANYSWISQQYFDQVDLGEDGTGLAYALNNPRNQVKLGFDFLPERFYRAGVLLRYQEGFEVLNGDEDSDFSGDLPSVTLVDARLGYVFPAGLRIDLTANNLLNRKYRPFPGLPKVGRMVIAKITYDF